jgi:glycerol dehydrogenase
VAWGLLVQLAAEGRPDPELAELAAFHSELGLPVCLPDLGLIEPAPDEIESIAALTATVPHVLNMPVPVDAAVVSAAIRRVEQLANRW